MQSYPPKNLAELEQRCQQIAAQPIANLARKLGLNIPDNLVHAKGWVGQLLEVYLGATAGSRAQPDFPALGVELKTIPVDHTGKPLESTYVCTVQANHNELYWRNSWVYNKLKHVLWVPIMDQTITTPFFWRMDDKAEDVLRTDWEELMEMLQLGYGKNLSAKFGTYLHIRPKAANSRVLVNYVDADGQDTKIVPKGFYLRPSFTAEILEKQKALCLSA